MVRAVGVVILAFLTYQSHAGELFKQFKPVRNWRGRFALPFLLFPEVCSVPLFSYDEYF